MGGLTPDGSGPDGKTADAGSDFASKVMRIIQEFDVEKVRIKKREERKRQREAKLREKEEKARKAIKDGLDRYIKYKSKALAFLPFMEKLKAISERQGFESSIRSSPSLDQLKTTYWENEGRYSKDDMYLEFVLKISKSGGDDSESHPHYGFKLQSKPILTSYSIVRGHEWEYMIYKKYKAGGSHSRKEVNYDDISSDFIEDDISRWLNKTLRLRVYYEVGSE